jgi:hypothetical protein
VTTRRATISAYFFTSLPFTIILAPTMWLRLPELIRRHPEREVVFSYKVPRARAELLKPRLEETMTRRSLEWESKDNFVWRVRLIWRTLVFGIIAREVEESVCVTLTDSEPGVCLTLRCLPQKTHEAHAAGAAGVVLLAVTVGLFGGFPGGILPGATTLVAGGLLADATRVLALTALEKKLKTLAVELGENLWSASRSVG